MEEHDDEKPAARMNLKLWKQMLRFARPYRGTMLILIGFAMLLAACEVALPILTGKIIDAITHRQSDRVWHLGMAFGGTFLVIVVCIFAFILAAGRITCGVTADIRQAAFAKLQSLQFAYFDRRAVGWLMQRLTSDCNSIARVAAWGLLDITWSLTLISAMSCVMFYLNWKLALIVCTVFPLLSLTTWFFQRRLLVANRRVKKTASLITGSFNESIQGVRTTKSLVREDENLREFAGLTSTMFDHSIRSATLSAMFLPIIASVCALGVGVALWAGGVQAIDGAISLGLLVTFLNYAGGIQGPAQELANTLSMLLSAQASAERIQGLLDEPITILDRTGTMDGPQRIESIEFRNVTFGYDPSSPVLRDFNLIVRAGQTIALVGATGGGKSTIVSLVCRFYEPTAGEIFVNGVEYRDLPLHWLHSSLGMVLQQPHLFSGTIRENIRYGRLDASDADIVRAATLTNAIQFIDRLPGGFDAAVGEGGNQLSTGQKQLIALARAVIADPKIFVMDEATSSVDTQTERDIQAAVERVLTDRIGFVIAHRLSTIKSADQILVIDAGRVVEQGSHHDLINRRGRYFELYTRQFTTEHEEELLRVQ